MSEVRVLMESVVPQRVEDVALELDKSLQSGNHEDIIRTHTSTPEVLMLAIASKSSPNQIPAQNTQYTKPACENSMLLQETLLQQFPIDLTSLADSLGLLLLEIFSFPLASAHRYLSNAQAEELVSFKKIIQYSVPVIRILKVTPFPDAIVEEEAISDDDDLGGFRIKKKKKGKGKGHKRNRPVLKLDPVPFAKLDLGAAPQDKNQAELLVLTIIEKLKSALAVSDPTSITKSSS